MRILQSLMLLLALALLAACNRVATEQSRQVSSPTPRATSTPAAPPVHPNQVAVSLGKTSPEAMPLNPRIIEAYSLATVKLDRSAAAPVGVTTTSEPRDESPQSGMKWLVVIVQVDAAQGEVAIPIGKIRIVDQSRKIYRLVSFGSTDSGPFMDFREYDKLKIVEPPKLIMKSPAAGRQYLLFAVGSKAEGLSLEF